MRSETTRQFRELLPEPAQRHALEPYRLFRPDPEHSSLRFKPVSPSDPTLFSARVGWRYRALGKRRGDLVVWFWIGSRADYDTLLRRRWD